MQTQIEKQTQLWQLIEEYAVTAGQALDQEAFQTETLEAFEGDHTTTQGRLDYFDFAIIALTNKIALL